MASPGAAPSGPTIEGTLFKWTNYWHGWQPRWFLLDQGVLTYYKSREEVCQGLRLIKLLDISFLIYFIGYHLRDIHFFQLRSLTRSLIDYVILTNCNNLFNLSVYNSLYEGCKGSVKISACEIVSHPIDTKRLDIIIPSEQHYYLKVSYSLERYRNIQKDEHKLREINLS